MADQEYDEGYDENEDNDAIAAPVAQNTIGAKIKKNLPLFVISAAFHFFILFIISLIPGQSPVTEEKKVVITDYVEQEEQEEIEEIEEVEVEETEVEVDTETETEEVEEVTEEVEMEEVEETEEVEQSEMMDAISDAPPADVSGDMMMMGIGGGGAGGGGGGMPTGYSNRSKGNQRKAVSKFGGDPKTIKAVEAALKWLAEHQESDGSWDAEKYEGHGGKYVESITAAAILPFLGAGHSERIGNYKKTVRSGIRFLNKKVGEKIKKNKAGPHFGKNYGSALILMALAEASIFGSSPSTTKNANAIAEMFLDQYKGTGWHYHKGGGDLSVSGWIALGLKSAKAAELKAMKSKDAKKMFEDYSDWIENEMTNEESGKGFYSQGQAKAGKGGTAHMTWVAMFQKQFLGFPKGDKFLKKASENTIDWIKQNNWVGKKDHLGDIYGVYYGTLGAFQQQGDVWKHWNKAMKVSLISKQRTGSPKKLGGSWDPTKGHTADVGGRVLTTALAALCLEVYYRYDVMQ